MSNLFRSYYIIPYFTAIYKYMLFWFKSLQV